MHERVTSQCCSFCVVLSDNSKLACCQKHQCASLWCLSSIRYWYVFDLFPWLPLFLLLHHFLGLLFRFFLLAFFIAVSICLTVARWSVTVIPAQTTLYNQTERLTNHLHQGKKKGLNHLLFWDIVILFSRVERLIYRKIININYSSYSTEFSTIH